MLPPTCIVKFTATWCGPCHAIQPYISTLAEQYKVPVTNIEDLQDSETPAVVIVDVDANDELTSKHSVTAMPTIILIKEGVEQARVVGGNRSKINEFFEKLQ